MEIRERPPWGATRRYMHFDRPLTSSEAERLVTSAEAVAKHSFWPLIGFTRRERRWKKDLKRWKRKSRSIAYAAHADSHIFAYYCHQLSLLYEQHLRTYELSECVLAYRPRRGKANYHFAVDAFVEIAGRDACDVIGADIEKFFDTIPHRELKSNWKRLLRVEELPPDHFVVYKAATRFAVVSLEQVRKVTGLGRRRFRECRVVPLSGAQFRDRILAAGLINRNNRSSGIPQGLPISGLLANIVLMELDAAVHEACQRHGGVYRRYSDDILIISRPGTSDEIEGVLKQELDRLGLGYQPTKTVRCTFARDKDGVMSSDRPLPYLGFEFDGQRVTLRPQTLARYSKRMVRAVRRARRTAFRRQTPGQPLRLPRRSLYGQFSHLDAHPSTPPHKRRRGSFFKYARRAHATALERELEGRFASQILRQLRRQWAKLNRLIEEAEQESVTSS